MKKTNHSFFWSAVTMATIALTGCSKHSSLHPDEALQTISGSKSAVSTLTTGPIIAAHRANELLKVDEIINAGIKSMEVDIFVGLKNGAPTCLIGHEAATATGQTLEQYFANLHQKMPDFEFLWLDCKDLNSAANETLFMNTLKKMDSLYAIKNRVLVESRYIPYLVSFKQQNWPVSYYCNWEDVYGKPYATQQSVMNQMYTQLTTYGIDGISYDAAIDTSMKNFFSSKTVGGSNVKMYSWHVGRYYGEAGLDAKLAAYGHLSVLLISFLNNNPATISDGANYKLVSAVNGLGVVDVNSQTPVNGTEVTLWANNYPTTNNQVWKLRSLGGGYYAFKSLADTTKVLEVAGGASANSTPVQVGTFSNSNAQRWQIVDAGGGYYNFTPACAPGKNLDVNGGSSANDTPIQIYSAHTYNSQKFKMVKQ